MSFAGPSGRLFDPLPIDAAAAFPQSFTLALGGVRYEFALYVNVPETALGDIDEVMSLPDSQRFLVVRIDMLAADGTPEPVFLRKVVPSLEYRAGALALTFPTQQVARRNLNGAGNFGTQVIGGVATS